ncbi:carbonic anhydrase [Aeromicrobium sp. 636]|uniref:carbonic anhydrase n=1 Tax=Aeromicrobium senzhongii TaxID=2663859 RepID=A0A8I0K1H7_9ACTN|nr:MULTISPECIES: carbonic anhydrase [Aeromicrobium]MBC9224874.1 carbonic anhydrase [Aeromicrobium senzhongii]MCQ3996986.1 carbonic anhydrase [Aeromicrobium sp. 636]MTB86920.1 carbonic anhydrase [Aeromicrobium senzhongii]QNL93250.1 carbonic anhydrase [Aeromicrobium senzhongii]
MTSTFDDLLEANRRYSQTHEGGFDGIARAGVLMVTCMDSRIDPLAVIGLQPGDAKILRNPGGRVTDQVLVAIVLGVSLLKVERVVVMEHTRCAMATSTEADVKEKIGAKSGTDASWMTIGVIEDQESTVRADVNRVRSHPLVPDSVSVGGFIYDVDSGLMTPVD